MSITMKALEKFMKLQKKDNLLNENGCEIHRVFMDDERYTVDFASDFTAEGWEQYDTDQDAPYFGVWINQKKLLTLTYCEGDWSFVVCPNADAFNAEIQKMNTFYGSGFIAKVIDTDGSMTVLEQDRQSFLIP
jgi:hypothetical protein